MVMPGRTYQTVGASVQVVRVAVLMSCLEFLIVRRQCLVTHFDYENMHAYFIFINI